MTPTPNRFHPGEYLRDELAVRCWSIETLVEKSGLGRDRLEEIMGEKRDLTRLDCLCLARAFSTSAETWRKLQDSYDKGNQGFRWRYK